MIWSSRAWYGDVIIAMYFSPNPSRVHGLHCHYWHKGRRGGVNTGNSHVVRLILPDAVGSRTRSVATLQRFLASRRIQYKGAGGRIHDGEDVSPIRCPGNTRGFRNVRCERTQGQGEGRLHWRVGPDADGGKRSITCRE
jgi:hypothetical protein